MEMAHLILGYVQALAWPFIVLFGLFLYRDIIRSLLPRSKLKFTIAGVTIEPSIEVLQRSVQESFRGGRLSEAQWEWLRRLARDGRLPYDHKHYIELRRLRNSGLIREHPEGTLTASDEIEITTLGRLLLNAHDHGTPNT
jgi:nicotinic acid phosphoribosyltransferase